MENMTIELSDIKANPGFQKFRVAMGLLLITFAGFYLYGQRATGVSPIQWAMVIVFLINGFINILSGLSADDTYIKTDKGIFYFKFKQFGKAKKIPAETIQQVIFRTTSIVLVMDNDDYTIHYSRISYSALEQLKRLLEKAAKENNIKLTVTP
jgi:hypothetical protein